MLPATGSDGHADIVDVAAGVIHSFWQLKQVDGKWVAAQHAWMPLNGRGFADPAHYFQGARAVGIPAMAGIIRKHEVADGKALYEHALAMSLTFNALSSSPAYAYPATSADYSAKDNYGQIPEGALLILPPSFDVASIANPDLRKVANTLKTYGAYVVDRNYGTPYVIYVENGSAFNLMPKGWDNRVASDLDRIRAALRQVVSAPAWIDGNGRALAPAQLGAQQASLNLLSMRGSWSRVSGSASGSFDSASQRLVFPASSGAVKMQNYSGRGIAGVAWGSPQNKTLRLSVHASGGATLRLIVRSGSGVVFDSGPLGDKQSALFAWPASGSFSLEAASPAGPGSSVGAELVPAR